MKASVKASRSSQGRLLARKIGLVLAAATAALVFASPTSAVTVPLPNVYTGGAVNVGSSTALLLGAVNAKGQATTYLFQYGASRALGLQTPPAPAGPSTATVRVGKAVGGLQSNTLYYYRLIASDARGTVLGAEHSFRTRKVPLSIQIAATPSPVPFGDSFTLAGTLSGTGGGGRVVALQANPFPYTTGFKTLGNPEVTSATGAFSFPVVGLLSNTQLRVVMTAAPYLASPVLLQGVAVQVSLHVRQAHRHRRGNFVRFYGTITPAEPGAHIGIQLLRPGGRSINQGGTIVTSASAGFSHFSTVVRVRHRGLYQVLVQVFDGSHVSAYSEPVRIG
ncbi:MAG TPA: hypothetical protein VNU24_06905 [Solirubrobacteraceae bacterium]|jgi:hypothetical protein|nr:hypothetical protein [Solirubrobacteraceae bacterium]